MVPSLPPGAPHALRHLAHRHRSARARPGVQPGAGAPPQAAGARLSAGGGTRARQTRAGGGGGGGGGRSGSTGGKEPDAHGVRPGPAARGAAGTAFPEPPAGPNFTGFKHENAAAEEEAGPGASFQTPEPAG